MYPRPFGDRDDKFIQMWIAQSLIDGSKTRLGTLEGGLSGKLPAAHVADGEDHASANRNIPLDDFAVHKGRDAEDRFPRKNAALNEQIPLAPSVVKWRNVSHRISDDDISFPKTAERFSVASRR